MPSAKDWQEFLEVVEPVAEKVDNEFVEEQVKDEPEAPAEDESKDESKEGESKPFISFNSKKEFQEAIDARLADRFERMERKAKEDKAEAEAEARRSALKENEEFKKLYEEEAQPEIEGLRAKIQELEGQQETLNTYRETLDSYYEARVSELDLPRGVTALLEKMEDPKDRLDYLTEYGSEFTTAENVPSGETPDESGTPEADEAARADSSKSFARSF